MDKQVRIITGEIEVHTIPVQIEMPVYTQVEKPEYVLVKEEITYTVPRIEYETKTYERPVFKDKVYEIPVYKEVVYEKPVYKEVVYEVPRVKYVDKVIEIPKIHETEQIVITKVPYEIEVPKIIRKDQVVVNAIVHDQQVTNAIINHVTVEALHPKYLCSKCKQEVVDAS